MLMPKAEGDASLQLYVSYGPVGPLAVPAVGSPTSCSRRAIPACSAASRRVCTMW